jgi:predicted DNA-binding protein (UPF0251 family)
MCWGRRLRLLLSLDELAVTLAALRLVDQTELAERLAAILRQIQPSTLMRLLPES